MLAVVGGGVSQLEELNKEMLGGRGGGEGREEGRGGGEGRVT